MNIVKNNTVKTQNKDASQTLGYALGLVFKPIVFFILLMLYSVFMLSPFGLFYGEKGAKKLFSGLEPLAKWACPDDKDD